MTTSRLVVVRSHSSFICLGAMLHWALFRVIVFLWLIKLLVILNAAHLICNGVWSFAERSQQLTKGLIIISPTHVCNYMTVWNPSGINPKINICFGILRQFLITYSVHIPWISHYNQIHDVNFCCIRPTNQIKGSILYSKIDKFYSICFFVNFIDWLYLMSFKNQT